VEPKVDLFLYFANKQTLYLTLSGTWQHYRLRLEARVLELKLIIFMFSAFCSSF